MTESAMPELPDFYAEMNKAGLTFRQAESVRAYALAYGRACMAAGMERLTAAILSEAASMGWAMKDEDPFEDCVQKVIDAAIRKELP